MSLVGVIDQRTPRAYAEGKGGTSMSTLMRFTWVFSAVLLTGMILFWHGSVRAELTADELKCEIKTSLTVGKFVAKKLQCIRSCQQDAYAQAIPPTDCVPPYAGKTGGCVQSTEAKTQGLGKRKCAL